jgi:hypothetical protein
MERILEKAYLIKTVFELNETILSNQNNQKNYNVNKLINYLIELRDNDKDFNFSEIIYTIDNLIYEIRNYTKTLKENMEYEFEIAQIQIDNLNKTKEIIKKNKYISINFDLESIVLLNEKISNLNIFYI